MNYGLSCLLITFLISTQPLLSAEAKINVRPRENAHNRLLESAALRPLSTRKACLKAAGCSFLIVASGFGVGQLIIAANKSYLAPSPFSPPCTQTSFERFQADAERCDNRACPQGFVLTGVCLPSEPDELSFPRIEAQLRKLCPGNQTINLVHADIGICKEETPPLCKPLDEAIQELTTTCDPLSPHARLKAKFAALKAQRTRK